MHKYKQLHFEWDAEKNKENISKHGVTFYEAKEIFFDPKRVIVKDVSHSFLEERYYCIGLFGKAIMMVRFTVRSEKIRIYGAGYWRKGKKIYEKFNKIHR